MDLYSGDPYWLVKNGFLYPYSTLNKNITCDVAVIGSGITGALVAYHLQQKGAKVTIVDRRHVATGSTCASTGLLQYEIDTPLKDLISKVGQKNADESYLCCIRAIYELKKIAESLPLDCKFKLKKSLYLASTAKDVVELQQEFSERKRLGIKIKLLTQKQIKKLFGFHAPAALYSNDAAQLDPFLFTQGLLQHLLKKQCNVFDLTEVTTIKENKASAELKCANGFSIFCKKFVFASGYESQSYLSKKITMLHSTYAIISKPNNKKHLGLLKPLIWETARPYLYIRTTADNRIIVGGKDEKFYSPDKRDKLIKIKAKELQKEFIKKYPTIPFEVDYSWAGTFAETKDGLPYIGVNKEYKHAYFALGFGGNGIVFSQIAGELISNLFVSGTKDEKQLFGFDR